MIGVAKKRQVPIMLQRYENFMRTKVAGIVLVLILSTETCLCDNYGPSYVRPFPRSSSKSWQFTVGICQVKRGSMKPSFIGDSTSVKKIPIVHVHFLLSNLENFHLTGLGLGCSYPGGCSES